MQNKKTCTWVEWAVDLVKESDLCPGLMPTGVFSHTQLTHAEFSAFAEKSHDHSVCGHYKNEVLGLQLPVSDMLEIKGIDARTITAGDADRLRRDIEGGVDHPALIELRRDLHNYVDAIELRAGGKLHIPSNLLKLNTFVKEFFNVKD